MQHLVINFAMIKVNPMSTVHPLYSELVTAMGKETVVELADLAKSDPTWVPALIEASKHDKPKNRNRKAAWVLHHVFLRNPALIESEVSGLLAILDHSDDASVYREILKIIADINLTPKHFELIQAPMLDLGVGMLHDEAWSKGIHYIAMRLVMRFATSTADKSLAIEAIQALLSRTSKDQKPMCNAALKIISKIQKIL
jgi:hypothetical protein